MATLRSWDWRKSVRPSPEPYYPNGYTPKEQRGPIVEVTVLLRGMSRSELERVAYQADVAYNTLYRWSRGVVAYGRADTVDRVRRVLAGE